MDKKEIIAFFDRCAPHWDAEQLDRSAVIERILDASGISAGMRVLDVACGTGIMFPHYLQRGVASVTGVDISPEMARLASEKFREESAVTVLCADVEEAAFSAPFDAVMVHNAFPHFPQPERLIARLSSLLTGGGTLTVAHSLSRDTINAHHQGGAHHVSLGLMPADELAALFSRYLTVETVISDDEMYQVTGRR